MLHQRFFKLNLCRALWLGTLTAAFCCARSADSLAQTYVPGQTYFGRSNYVEYIAGDLPLIFSAPHGGALTPSEIPNRVDDGSDPKFATVTDSNTEQLALALRKVFCNYFGHSPHVIICQLKRTKVDCDRSLSQGVYHANVFATQAWNEFQNYISTGSNAAVAQSGFGFYIDLHGQGHAIQRLELGYLLTASQLTKTDAQLDQPTYAAQSSIRTLATLVSKNFSMPFSRILRGPDSFGGLMEARGYPCVPDPDMPNPGDENPYFDGGYNTAVHSSKNGGGPIDGLQIEANMTGVRDTAINRTNYAIAIAETLDYFFTNYYGLDLRLSAPCVWNGGAGKWTTAADWGGILPVAGNYLLFNGPGGAVSNDLAALTTGTGRIYSVIFGTNASGTYTLYGKDISLNAGITNFSGHDQIISNSIAALSPQTFSAAAGALNLSGNVTNAGFNLSFDAETNLTVSGIISGSGGLCKSGGGVLTLTAANNYSGATTNLSGTLLVAKSAGSATGSGAVNIGTGATLSGDGIVGGPVYVSGIIAPGDAVGTLTATNGLIFTNGGSYCWTLAADSTSSPGVNFDQITLSGGSLILNSNSPLVIAFTNAANAPSTNDTFWQSPHSWKIISLGAAATNIGLAKFNVISNNNFTAGKFASTADAQGNVFLDFLPTPSPVISPALPGGGVGSLSISWSAVTNVIYQVQYSTNLAQGNWQPLGSLTTTDANAVFQDNSSAAPQRFYRVVIP